MSKNELLEAYASGLIGRREFVRGLVALGASVSAAAAYAVAIRSPTEASAATCYYPKTPLQCVAESLYEITQVNKRRPHR